MTTEAGAESTGPAVPPAAAARGSTREMLLLGALAVVTLLPFAWKAFNIDDPLFIWCAQQIVRHPLDPFGFSVNWFGVEMPMWEVMRNPPLASYYLALVGGVFGWNEFVLHAAMILAAAACVLGTAALARHFTTSGFFAGALMLTTPVFFLSSTTVMCDVLMLAFLVWAASAWISGVDGGGSGSLVAASALLTAAALTKFSALLVLPALALYGRKRIRLPQLAALAAPVVVLLAYLVAARALYGGSLFNALAMASAGDNPEGVMTRAMIFLTFLGGCNLGVVLVAPFLWPKQWRRVSLGLLIVSGALWWTGWHRGLTLQKLSLADPLAAAQVAAFTVAGMAAIALCVALWRSARGPAWLLLPWIAAMMLFAAFTTWTVSGRYLLPMAPAFVIGAVCVMDSRRLPGVHHRRGRTAAVLLAAIVSLWVAAGDASLANSARSAAERICQTFGANVWFQGHWGFQYYMELRGARALDAQSSQVSPGEIVVVPDNNANTFPLDRRLVKLRETLEFGTNSAVSTMNREVRAGFYASIWGPLPYAAGVISPEKYYILSIVSP